MCDTYDALKMSLGKLFSPNSIFCVVYIVLQGGGGGEGGVFQ